MEPDAASGMRELVGVVVGAASLTLAIAVHGAIAGWVVNDAHKRGYSGSVPLFWLCSGGLVSGLIWLCLRPGTRLVDRPVDDFANVDEALDAASKLDVLGDWDEAIVLYQYAAARWPEHEGYVKKCIKVINDKSGGN
jgi:hypothetical protein